VLVRERGEHNNEKQSTATKSNGKLLFTNRGWSSVFKWGPREKKMRLALTKRFKTTFNFNCSHNGISKHHLNLFGNVVVVAFYLKMN
jgi:hypothetical protein